ncbi:MAG: hypothetical protein AB9891_21205 [Anaerolineaceae bacterium]
MNRKVTFFSIFVIVALILSAYEAAPTATEAPAPTNPPAAQAASAGGKVRVFSWWTSGGEAAALDALVATLKEYDPTVEFVSATVAGAIGSNACAVLQTRLVGGNLPDSWQIYPGSEMMDQYAAAG